MGDKPADSDHWSPRRAPQSMWNTNVCDSQHLWLSSLHYLKGGFTCHFISSIHTLWFIGICHSLQLLWNDSFPYKSLSHKLKHFYPIYPYVLVCIFPNLTQLYFPCISSHRLTITKPSYARLAGKVFDKPYTNGISQEVLHFKWQKSNSNSIKPKKDFTCSHKKEGQGYNWGQVE